MQWSFEVTTLEAKKESEEPNMREQPEGEQQKLGICAALQHIQRHFSKLPQQSTTAMKR